MESKYLVISRGQDEPRIDILSEAELQGYFDWPSYTILTEAPEFEYMAPNTVFIFKGETVRPAEARNLTL